MEKYCWVTAAYEGALALSKAAMFNQLSDSEQLAVAAVMVQAAGDPNKTYNLGKLPGGNNQENWTIKQLTDKASAAANAKDPTGASLFQSAIAQAQSRQTLDVQTAQQFCSQQTNVATSTDPQTINQVESQMSAINNNWSQWAQLGSAIGA